MRARERDVATCTSAVRFVTAMLWTTPVTCLTACLNCLSAPRLSTSTSIAATVTSLGSISHPRARVRVSFGRWHSGLQDLLGPAHLRKR